jgi:Holliday junction resolvase RusA-like endonuclease
MLIVMFNVPGKPKGKGRPRFARRGNFVKTYTDSKTADYEAQIKVAATAAMGSSEPLESPVSVYLYIRVPIPASASKKAKKAMLSGEVRPTKKPDIDNIAKSYLDALNGIVYLDDTQVISLHCTKVYSSDPGVNVMVREEVL